MHFPRIKKYSDENFGSWLYVFIFMVDAVSWTSFPHRAEAEMPAGSSSLWPTRHSQQKSVHSSVNHRGRTSKEKYEMEGSTLLYESKI